MVFKIKYLIGIFITKIWFSRRKILDLNFYNKNMFAISALQECQTIHVK